MCLALCVRTLLLNITFHNTVPGHEYRYPTPHPPPQSTAVQLSYDTALPAQGLGARGLYLGYPNFGQGLGTCTCLPRLWLGQGARGVCLNVGQGCGARDLYLGYPNFGQGLGARGLYLGYPNLVLTDPLRSLLRWNDNLELKTLD